MQLGEGGYKGGRGPLKIGLLSCFFGSLATAPVLYPAPSRTCTCARTRTLNLNVLLCPSQRGDFKGFFGLSVGAAFFVDFFSAYTATHWCLRSIVNLWSRWSCSASRKAVSTARRPLKKSVSELSFDKPPTVCFRIGRFERLDLQMIRGTSGLRKRYCVDLQEGLRPNDT